jgi:hypothetical protein
MTENLRSILTGTAGLAAGMAAALLLTILRAPAPENEVERERASRIFLIGLAVQCLHFLEEFLAGFEDRFPRLLGLPAWSNNFFVAFNLIWLCIWIISVVGLMSGYRSAYFPAWFFAIASIMNGIAHPILCIIAQGYFPGLVSSPVVGVIGVLLWIRLWALTAARDP